MAKIKLTKGELKRQRDAMRQYERYLPTLQLKKQQLQIEIRRQTAAFEEKAALQAEKEKSIREWAGLLGEPGVSIRQWVVPQEIVTGEKNIAGVDIPVFERAEFSPAEYDLFAAPLWVDSAIGALRELVSAREEIAVLKKGAEILKRELRVTAQRVNLFEKIKIPEAREAIRLIKIYIGDQMANAVGRSKAAKRKIEQFAAEGAPA